MIKHAFKGKFIVFEGLDGAGSSTQIELLSRSLKKRGSDAIVTKEPTNNIVGGIIRGQLTGDWKSSMECLQLLFAADRAHHLERLILPALKDKKVVLSDRYFFSTVAFGSLDIDKDWLLALNSRFVLPDLTILLNPRQPLPNWAFRRRKKVTKGLDDLRIFSQEIQEREDYRSRETNRRNRRRNW